MPQNLTHLSYSCVYPQIIFCLNRTYRFSFYSYSLVESLGYNEILLQIIQKYIYKEITKAESILSDATKSEMTLRWLMCLLVADPAIFCSFCVCIFFFSLLVFDLISKSHCLPGLRFLEKKKQ